MISPKIRGSKWFLAGILAAISISALAVIGGGIIVHNHSSGSQGGATLTLTRPVTNFYGASTTYSKPAGLRTIDVIVVGGGGGGGGSTGIANASSGGGASGTTCYSVGIWASSLLTTETITVGAGGTAASATAGGAGGISAFNVGGSAALTAFGGGGGATAATMTGGDVNINDCLWTSLIPSGDRIGTPGHHGISPTGGNPGGNGGSTWMGAGGRGGQSAANGQAGTLCGGGGGGGGTGTTSGGAGGGGCVVIVEHYF